MDNIEKLLEDTFTAHEHAAPDGDAVLAETRRRIDRRRTVLSRPLAVAAGVMVLVVAAVTVVALNRPAPDESGVAAPARTTTKAPAKPAIEDLKMPYALGWLPPGDVAYQTRRINIGSETGAPDSPPVYGGEYMFTVTAKGRVLQVDVQQFGMMGLDQAAFKSGPGNPVTVGGQQGVESANSGGPGGYELYLAHAKGGTMYVNVAPGPGSTATAQQLVEVGHRVAQNIRVPGRATVTPTFGLRDLPDKTHVCAFEVAAGDLAAHGSTTNYDLGTCTGLMPSVFVGTNAVNKPAGTPGKPVQGHETRHAEEDNGYLTLWVLDAVKGAPVTIAGRVSLEDLYDIANHLVLPR
jgi:hypothetical protein